jgi:hypothetical protein
MNVWLHRQVMLKLADGGGKAPGKRQALRHRGGPAECKNS